MIVRPHGTSSLLITQPDHAALAARIMERWQADGFPVNPRRGEILRAVAEHDNGWIEFDAKPMLGADGAVLDFSTVDGEVKRNVWPRAIARLARHPYAAALVAHHAAHVYRRYRTDGEWVDFFIAMETARRAYLGIAGVAMDTMLGDYLFLRMGDLMSLAFCNAWTDIQKDDTGSVYAMRLDGDRLLVTPDPFGGTVVDLAIEGRESGTTGDDAAAWAAARRLTITGTATGTH